MLKKKLFVSAIIALALFATVTASAATLPIKVGSKGADVMTVQTAVGVKADGTFGLLTKAAVIAFQTNHSLTADGIVGAKTWAAIIATPVTPSTGTFPAGCTSAAGFSTTTGLACTTATTFPAGCVSALGFSPTTGASCAGGSSTTVTGGAGSATITGTNSGTESTVKEGATDKNVLAFKVKAEDSDIAITNVKVVFQNGGTNDPVLGDAASSDKITKYLDSVKVLMGTTEVGSADASAFSKTALTGNDEYTKSIALSNAVVKEGKTVTFYVAVDVASSIDSSHDIDAKWVVTADPIRYVDGTGAILSNDGVAPTDNFGFEAANTDDSVSIKTDTANPAASNIEVSSTDKTSDVLIGAFKIKAGTSSGDIQLDEMPIDIYTTDAQVDGTSTIDDMIDSVYVKIDGKVYEANLDTTTADNFDGGAVTYLVSFDNGDMIISGGDTSEVKIYATFNKTNDGANYAANAQLQAKVALHAIDAEGVDSGDKVIVDSSFTGEIQTLSADAVTTSLTSATLTQASAGSDAKAATYVAKFAFSVTAPSDKDIYLPASTFDFGTAGHAGVEYTVSNDAVVTSAVLSSVAKGGVSAAEKGNHDNYLINADDTKNFVFSVYLTGDNTTDSVKISGIWYSLDSDMTFTDGSTGAQDTLTSGLKDFETDSVYLAE